MILPRSHTGKPPSNLLFLYSFVHSLHLLLLKLRFLTSVCLLILSQELWKPVVFQAVLYFIFSASWRLFWGKAYRRWFGVKALFCFPACSFSPTTSDLPVAQRLLWTSLIFLTTSLSYRLSTHHPRQHCINLHNVQKYLLLLKNIAKTPTVKEQPPTVLSEPLSFSDLPERGLGLQFLCHLRRENHFTPLSQEISPSHLTCSQLSHISRDKNLRTSPALESDEHLLLNFLVMGIKQASHQGMYKV